MTWSFLATALIFVLMPGTGVVYTLAVSLGQGLRADFVVLLGCKPTRAAAWNGPSVPLGSATEFRNTASAKSRR